jgi:hypothetical protein
MPQRPDEIERDRRRRQAKLRAALLLCDDASDEEIHLAYVGNGEHELLVDPERALEKIALSQTGAGETPEAALARVVKRHPKLAAAAAEQRKRRASGEPEPGLYAMPRP